VASRFLASFQDYAKNEKVTTSHLTNVSCNIIQLQKRSFLVRRPGFPYHVACCIELNMAADEHIPLRVPKIVRKMR
jgi:hypothetical protein